MAGATVAAAAVPRSEVSVFGGADSRTRSTTHRTHAPAEALAHDHVETSTRWIPGPVTAYPLRVNAPLLGAAGESGLIVVNPHWKPSGAVPYVRTALTCPIGLNRM